jgi:hypothetical protein
VKALFISSMSEHHCPNCNRLRLTAAGHLQPCLFAAPEVDVKGPLRRGADDQALGRLFHEAMAMKKPTVVGARGIVGFREQVIPSGPDQTGVHVNGEDPADIAWGIKETLVDPKRAQKWGANGRERVLKYFTWRTAAEQTIDIYKKIIHGDLEGYKEVTGFYRRTDFTKPHRLLVAPSEEDAYDQLTKSRKFLVQWVSDGSRNIPKDVRFVSEDDAL